MFSLLSCHIKDPLFYLGQNFTQSFFPLRFNNTTTHEINLIIHSLKRKDSCGYDKISTRILKMSAPYILSPLTYIFNKALSTGMFPDRLKLSEVKTLLKKHLQLHFRTTIQFLF